MTILAEPARTVTLRKHTIPVGLYINGIWKPVGETFSVVNPATGQEIARVANGTVDDALRALDAAAGAQAAWREVPPRQRANLFHKAHRLLMDRAASITETMTLESGKPLSESRAEFQLSADFFLWYTEQIAHLHGTYAYGSNGGYRIVTTCKFRNAGQACVAANRIIVQEAVADSFTEKFVAATKRLRAGDGFDPEVNVGPIISSQQLDNVSELVSAFRRSGARLLTGGTPLPGDGYFFEPTVFEVNNVDSELCNQELFAPIATIYRVRTAAEAIEFANDTRYGLAAYLFTRDISRAISMSEHLDFGMVGINRGIMADPAAAFGGVKASGLGREGGHNAIYEFLEPKYLAITVDEKARLVS